MAKMQYSEDQLFEMGRIHYEKLALHCQTLEVSGFWEQAQKVMQQTSTEVLDLYVQSVLMKLAIHCGNILKSQFRFIQTVSISNPLGITEDMVVDDALIRDVDKVYNMPPVLIQLCSLYDKQNHDDMTEYFLDALLNILLCMEYLNSGKDAKINEFIQKYYNRIGYYVNGKTAVEHSKYVFRKLSSDTISCDVEKKEILSEKKKENKQKTVSQETAESEKETSKEQSESREERNLSEDAECSEEVLQTQTETSNRTQETQQIHTLEHTGEADGTEASGHNEETVQKEKAEQIEKPDSSKEAVQSEQSEVSGKTDHDTEKNQSDKMDVSNESKKASVAIRKEELQTPEQIAQQAKEQFMAVKQRIQEREAAEAKMQEQKVQALVDELNGLVGLKNVKKEIQSLINLIKIRKIRQKMNLPDMEMSYHMVFTGSPGTGKTTVARLVAKIYKELGILTEGNLVETDRSGLVAGYVGQTAIKVHELVEQAIGGVLFIDEAYSLANPDMQNDFGIEAVDTLVKLMEDHRDNLVIIVAGYTDEMQDFLKSNTGLISRFNKFIDFPDYTKSELVSIMNVMAEKAGLELEVPAQRKLLRLLGRKSEEEWQDFGNARGIRNLFEKFVMNQANRLVLMETPTKEDLVTIKKEDVAV